MTLSLINIAKKYNNNWVFRNINFEFNIPGTYLIKGANGSGKSTLLKIISKYLSSSEGEQKLIINSKYISDSKWSKHIAYSGPYFELIEEMYLDEFIEFYMKFKPLRNGISKNDLIKIADLEKVRQNQIKNLSSGMKQRLKIAIAWLSDVSIILLDEPCSNLDQKGITWYKNIAKKYVYFYCSDIVISTRLSVMYFRL